MAGRLHHYEGRDIAVTYELKRCVHAAECIARAPEAFDSTAMPWIQPDGEPADEVAQAVARCPTGALHFTRKDGGDAEVADTVNSISPARNGPLYMRGSLRLVAEDGSEILRDTRVALCRCGASRNKPFCDNSHNAARFKASGGVDENWMARDAQAAQEATLTIRLMNDGPLEARGPMEIIDEAGASVCTGSSAELCRCGQSNAKPFCDSTHQLVEFKS